MLESIIDTVKSEVIASVAKQTGLGPQEAEKTVPLAKDSITEGITGALTGGNLGGILDMLRGADAGSSGGGLLQNAVFQKIAGQFVHKLTGQLGLSEEVSQKVAAIVLPIILGKIAGKTRQAGDTDDIDKGSLMDALGMNAGDVLGNLFGGNKGGKSGGLGNLFG